MLCVSTLELDALCSTSAMLHVHVLHVHVYPVMMFFNKGSLFQVVLCMALALGFLCTSAWYQPYASPTANLFKIGTEAALVRKSAT